MNFIPYFNVSISKCIRKRKKKKIEEEDFYYAKSPETSQFLFEDSNASGILDTVAIVLRSYDLAVGKVSEELYDREIKRKKRSNPKHLARLRNRLPPLDILLGVH